MTLLGATGLVGGHVVRGLAADPGVARVVLPGRRAPGADASVPAPGGAEVRWTVVDFEALAAHREAFRTDQLFVCLGTTRRAAGSPEAFRRVDHDYVVEAATLAVEEGARDLLLVSSLGADASSRMLYPRVKGEVEDAVAELPFRSVALLRPSLLLGERDESRPAEAVTAAVGRTLSPLLRGPLARWRPVEAAAVARAMVRLAAAPRQGVRVVESEEIRVLGGG